MCSSPKQPLLSILLLLFLVSLACGLPQSTATPPTIASVTSPANPTIQVPTPSNTPGMITSPTAPPTSPPPVAEHRIASHIIYGVAGLYDRTSMATFIPRGVGYSILAPVLDHYEDRLFATGIYDHNRVSADFSNLSAAGYNTVRITLDGCRSGNTCIGLENGQGLNPEYLDNIVDLMQVAKQNNLFLLLASDEIPELGGYAALANQQAGETFAPGRNAEYLTQAGIRVAQQYWADLLVGLAIRQAPFDIVLGWELIGEQYYQFDQPPFSLQSGNVTAANGKSYDMYILAQKRAMALDGMRYYIDQLRQTIHTYDPTALLTMGFLVPASPNSWRNGDSRYVDTAGLLSYSSLDFFYLHADPGTGLTMTELAQNFGLDIHVSKPVLMEVGAQTWEYPLVSDGAIAVQDWIAETCPHGFVGWIYSNFYPVPAGLEDATWGLVDGQDALLNALAPKNQPDACSTTTLPGRNLALGKHVEASAALPDQTAQMAVDGDPNFQWSAGAFPPQWIEIDLGAPSAIGEIRLTVGQWPSGDTIHQLWVGTTRDSMQMVKEFRSNEFDYDVLSYVPTPPLKDIRYIRVLTTESPSWVSWREIEVLAPFPSTPTPSPAPSATATP